MSETQRNSSVNVPPSVHRMSVRFSVVVWMNFASGRECVQFEGKEKTASQAIGSISITGGPRGSKGYPVLVKREDVVDIANYRPVLHLCRVCSVAEACYLTAITATKRGPTVYSYHNVGYNVDVREMNGKASRCLAVVCPPGLSKGVAPRRNFRVPENQENDWRSISCKRLVKWLIRVRWLLSRCSHVLRILEDLRDYVNVHEWGFIQEGSKTVSPLFLSSFVE